MICKTCAVEGRVSRVTNGGARATMMYCPPFFDEQGKRHHHDRNTTTTGYRCSNGHVWEEKRTGSCWCGWPEKKDGA